MLTLSKVTFPDTQAIAAQDGDVPQSSSRALPSPAGRIEAFLSVNEPAIALIVG